MTENFPFDNAEDFLNEFKGNAMDPEMMVTDVEIHAPAMPDKTPVQNQARLLGAALLGVGAITQDRWVLIAAVLGCVIIECFRLYSEQSIRGYRNTRIGDENIAMIEAAAHVKSSAIENG